jgi:N utilization substance protein B
VASSDLGNVAVGGLPPGPRRQARERALMLLYEAELTHRAPGEVLADQPARPDPFAVQLVEGVERHREQLDELIAKAAVGWEIGRMPVVDRLVMRIAAYELAWEPEVPVAVAIDEAVELAKRYSTDDSGRFVNGVLSTIARRVRREGVPGAS